MKDYIVKELRELCDPPAGKKIGVFLSGGIDSTVVLHHLTEQLQLRKDPRVIFTYTAKFGVSTDETEKASRVAQEYRTRHTKVEITDFLQTLPKIMKLFDRPRYNIWPYWLARKAKEDGVEVVYIGEGSDEIFGYPDRGYLEGWAGQLIYVRHTYDVICKAFGLDLKAPFTEWHHKMAADRFISPLLFYKPPVKEYLRQAYAGIIPPWVIATPTTAPAMCSYVEVAKVFGLSEVYGYARTKEEAKHFFQMAAVEAWLEAHRV